MCRKDSWSEKTGFLVLNIFKLWNLESEQPFGAPVVSPTLTVGPPALERVDEMTWSSSPRAGR